MRRLNAICFSGACQHSEVIRRGATVKVKFTPLLGASSTYSEGAVMEGILVATVAGPGPTILGMTLEESTLRTSWH